MLNDVKNTIAAIESIKGSLSYDRATFNNSKEYWQQELDNAVENGNDTTYYKDELEQANIALSILDKIDALFLDEIVLAAKRK